MQDHHIDQNTQAWSQKANPISWSSFGTQNRENLTVKPAKNSTTAKAGNCRVEQIIRSCFSSYSYIFTRTCQVKQNPTSTPLVLSICYALMGISTNTCWSNQSWRLIWAKLKRKHGNYRNNKLWQWRSLQHKWHNWSGGPQVFDAWTPTQLRRQQSRPGLWGRRCAPSKTKMETLLLKIWDRLKPSPNNKKNEALRQIVFAPSLIRLSSLQH